MSRNAQRGQRPIWPCAAVATIAAAIIAACGGVVAAAVSSDWFRDLVSPRDRGVVSNPPSQPVSTIIPTLSPEQIAANGVTTNSQWRPFRQQFGGIPMVLVPKGCFNMGSTGAEADEQPVNVVCIDAPFWIDETEVTQADFERLNGVKASANVFSGANRPVENITWFEAHDFCVLRAARLPTEAEWEYSARGPNNLVYPWGNNFVEFNLVYNRSASQGTASVGSIPAGASWVGALDLSGNVWEWVNSIYKAYPYNSDDGREALSGTDDRGVRGGSWTSTSSNNPRSAYRDGDRPTDPDQNNGFRCARSL